MGLDFLIPIFGILLVMIPVLGVTTIVTLRWGLKPFIETLANELKGSGFVAPEELEGRVEALSLELEAVTSELHRLREAQEFDRRLLESGASAGGRGGGQPGRGGPGGVAGEPGRGRAGEGQPTG